MEIPFVPMALTCSPFPATYLMTTATTGIKSTIIYYKNFYLILLTYIFYLYSNFIVQSLTKLKFLDHGLVQRSYKYESFPHNNYDREETEHTTRL